MSELRISGGLFRGRKIAVPDPARPTEGRVREALFSIWGDQVDGARLLDLSPAAARSASKPFRAAPPRWCWSTNPAR